jgi:hypothetical protein
MTRYIKIEAVAQEGSDSLQLRVEPKVLEADIGDRLVWEGIGGTPEIILDGPSGLRPVSGPMTIQENGTLKFRCSLVTPTGKISWDPKNPDGGHRVDTPSSGGRSAKESGPDELTGAGGTEN